MNHFTFAPLVAVACLLGSGLIQGQDAQHDDVEAIEVPAVLDTTPSPDLVAVADTIIKRTNALRKDQKQEGVESAPKLMESARAFAAYMARTDRYGHTADDRRPADRARAQGYDYCIVLENIAYAFNSQGFTEEALADKFVTGWKNSPGHRKNMLDPDVTETGVAIARSEKTGYYYAVQLFGRPKSAAITFKIENNASEAFEYSVGERSYTLEPRYTRTHIVCRSPEIEFRWSNEKMESVKLQTGAHLAVIRNQGNWAVQKR